MQVELQDVHPLAIPINLRTGLEELCILLTKEDTKFAKDVLLKERVGLPFVGLQNHFVQNSTIVVAIHNGDVVGFVSYFDDDKSRAIDLMCVHPEYRRKGIARQLLTKALEHAPTFVDVSVVITNDAGKALYESMGFKAFVTTMVKVN